MCGALGSVSSRIKIWCQRAQAGTEMGFFRANVLGLKAFRLSAGAKRIWRPIPAAHFLWFVLETQSTSASEQIALRLARTPTDLENESFADEVTIRGCITH